MIFLLGLAALVVAPALVVIVGALWLCLGWSLLSWLYGR